MVLIKKKEKLLSKQLVKWVNTAQYFRVSKKMILYIETLKSSFEFNSFAKTFFFLCALFLSVRAKWGCKHGTLLNPFPQKDALNYSPCFPGGSDSKESTCNAGDLGLIPWSRRSPGEEYWWPTPAFLPGEFHGQRSVEGYSPWGCRVRHHWVTNTNSTGDGGSALGVQGIFWALTLCELHPWCPAPAERKVTKMKQAQVLRNIQS